jgi:hypothetical protein
MVNNIDKIQVDICESVMGGYELMIILGVRGGAEPRANPTSSTWNSLSAGGAHCTDIHTEALTVNALAFSRFHESYAQYNTHTHTNSHTRTQARTHIGRAPAGVLLLQNARELGGGIVVHAVKAAEPRHDQPQL